MGVTILLPKDLMILSEDALVEYDMTPPVPPQLLSNFDKTFIEQAKINDLINASLSPGHYRSPNYKNRVIEKHWSPDPEFPKEMFFDLPSLNHNLNMNIVGSHRLFIPCAKSGGFIIQWKISDESNIDPQKGTLKIIIE